VIKNRHFLTIILCTAALFATVLLQYTLGKQPCSICILQRMLVFGIGLISVMRLIYKNKLLNYLSISGIVGLLGTCVYHTKLLMDISASCSDAVGQAILKFNLTVPWLNWIFEPKAICGQGDDYLLTLPLPVWAALLGSTLLAINLSNKLKD